MGANILIVEDEEPLTTLLRYNLEAEGWRRAGRRVYRAVAAVVGVAAGGGARPERDHGGGPGRAGTGEEPAVGRGQARGLGGAAGPGGGAGGAAAPVGD